MLFWILAIALTLGIAALLALPLLRARPGSGVDRSDVALYRDQLAEIDRDLARGVLPPEEAERSRTEIARRLLAADRAGGRALTEAPRGLSLGIAAVAALTVAGGGLWLYDRIGAPGYPDLPLAQRMADARERFENRLPQAEAEAQAAAIVEGNRIVPPDEILSAVQSARDALRETPDDIATLGLLLEFEVTTRNWPAAARLMGDLVALRGAEATVEDLVSQVDLNVFAANGYVSVESMDILREVARRAPDHPALGYFEGLVFLDAGRPDLAVQSWRPLVENGDPDSVLIRRARAMIVEAAQIAGIDYTPPAIRGPSAADIAAAADMSDEDRQAMIRGMVDQLSDRLATQGGPVEDWARLISSLGILGDTDQAGAIWREAQEVFGTSEAALATLADAAARAGLTE